jgi:hypothetical protein
MKSPQTTRKQTQSARKWALLERIRQDGRYAFHPLRGPLEFWKAAVISLALGIAATTTVASRLSAQTVDQLKPHRVKVEQVEYKGKLAIKIVEDGSVPDGEAYAIVNGATFHNGEIQLELAGQPAGGASAAARGFIGIAFRMKDDKFEYIYLRPTNGRADDQVRRNHSTQYGSYPNFTFDVSRAQAPEKYESYVDLEPGEWTRYRITVEGSKARLYVHGAAQPCLIVNDLKLGDSSGGVALWIGPGTEGYFTGLQVRNAE